MFDRLGRKCCIGDERLWTPITDHKKGIILALKQGAAFRSLSLILRSPGTGGWPGLESQSLSWDCEMSRFEVVLIQSANFSNNSILLTSIQCQCREGVLFLGQAHIGLGADQQWVPVGRLQFEYLNVSSVGQDVVWDKHPVVHRLSAVGSFVGAYLAFFLSGLCQS